MTVASPIKAIVGKSKGVLSVNILAQTLSNSINDLKVLKTGYCYLLDTNSSNVVSHPKLTANCYTIQCVEELNNPNEYMVFRMLLLNPLHEHPLSVVDKAIYYKKNGQTWMMTCALAIFGTVNYTVVVTVPKDEVDEATINTNNSINATVVDMIIVFSFVIVLFLVCLILFSYFMVISIVNPVNDLRGVLKLIRNDDLSSKIPQSASSQDMKVLLEAFSKLIIALRFSSDSYSKGNNSRAHTVFTDALELFTLTGNKRGIGASLNNLAAVELSMGNFDKAEALNLRAIANAEELLKLHEADKNPEDIDKVRRILSDRKGNLAGNNNFIL